MMEQDQQLRDRLDAAIGEGPAHRELGQRLKAGRQAVRRRRLAAGGAALATAAVVGFGAVAVTSGGSGGNGDREPQVAADPTTSSTPSQSASGPEPDAASPCDAPCPVRYATADEASAFIEKVPKVAYADGGQLVIADGWRVTDFSQNPMEFPAPARSAGLEVTDGTSSWFVLLAKPELGGWGTWDPTGKRFATLDAWLADEVAFHKHAVEEAPVEVQDGVLIPQSSVTVLDQVMGPPEADGYGPRNETAAVQLRMPDGRMVFALVVGDQVTTVEPAVLEAPTMSAFLQHLGGQADSGEGLR